MAGLSPLRVVLVLLLITLSLLMAPRPVMAIVCEEDDRVDDQILIELVPGAAIESVVLDFELTLLERVDRLSLYLVQIQAGSDVDTVVSALASDLLARVTRAEPHRRLETPEGVQLSIPDLDVAGGPAAYHNQDATTTIGLTAAQSRYTGQGVTVAVIDNGMALSHPELVNQLLGPGTGFAEGSSSPGAQGNGQDDDSDGLTDEALHHATFVAGLVHLVAPDARVLPIRTLDAEGRGNAFDLAKGILYAVDHGAKVISLSQAMLHDSRAVERALEAAADAGTIVVAAAGNRGEPLVDGTIEIGCRSFPASRPETIAVAAVDGSLMRAGFSDYGPAVDLSAPGIDLLSTFGEDGYAGWDGTSFSAPLVAGGVALILQKYPGLDLVQTRELLRQTTKPDNNGPELDGLMGAGVLDVDALTQALASDRTSLKVERAPGGTVLHWSPVLGATVYDVARGDTSNLMLGGPDLEMIDLGALDCLAEDLVLTDTTSVPDAQLPASGQVYFYLFRDDGPVLEGGGSYGVSSEGDPRTPGASDCLP